MGEGGGDSTAPKDNTLARRGQDTNPLDPRDKQADVFPIHRQITEANITTVNENAIVTGSRPNHDVQAW